MSEFVEDRIMAFRDAMAKEGIHYSGPIDADGHLHRFQVDQDPRGKRNGFYTLHLDERPAGVFGCNKRYGHEFKFHWSGKVATRLTPEQRCELAAKAAESKARRLAQIAADEAHAAARAQKMWDAAAPAENHPYLRRKGVGGFGVRVGEFWKENKEGKPYCAAKGALLIAVKDSTRAIVSLQAIYAEPLKIGDELRDKDFVYGGKKAGVWATIGAATEVSGRTVITICEGYATGASAHMATGLGVVVAFDAGNLIKVAREVRRLLPEALLVFLADNDRWTDKPVKNPGLTKAWDAARDVGGRVVVPEFADLEGRPTDLNDLHVAEGLDEVRRQIMAVADPQPEPPEEPPPADAADYGPIEDEAPEREAEPLNPPAAPEDDEDEIGDNRFFRVLGVYDSRIYIFQHRKKQITARGEADWSEAALTSIAPLQWWEVEFPGSNGLSRKMAVNWLQDTAYKKGVFDPDAMRGRGAWRDDGRFVFHFGDSLWVDGQIIDVTRIHSEFIYQQDRKLPGLANVPLSSAEGKRLFEAFQLFAWSRPASAILLAGWCALAPIGGALRWRPHVWITGPAGSGKTSILNFVRDLMSGLAVYAQGNSTEAGIRQTLGMDSRPVLFDESEQNNERETMRLQNILSLIRQSSTESDAQTLKGTAGGGAMHFIIRSMFCLGSIQVGLKQQADIERITVLTLRPKKKGTTEGAKAAENWQRISASLAAVRADQELAAKLLHRSLKLLPVTVQNVAVFGQAAAEKFGSMRDGDQYGTLMAGAWSLVSTKVATLDEARAMIARYDWSDYLEGSETEESDKALAALMGRLVRVKSQDVSLYELTARAAGRGGLMDVSRTDANAIITRFGLKIDMDDRDFPLLVAYTNEERDRLMAQTRYAADLKGQLLRIPGAEKNGKDRRFLGVARGCIRIPIDLVLGKRDGDGGGDEFAPLPTGDDLPMDDDWDDIQF